MPTGNLESLFLINFTSALGDEPSRMQLVHFLLASSTGLPELEMYKSASPEYADKTNVRESSAPKSAGMLETDSL